MYRVVYEYTHRRIFVFFALNTFYILGVRISVRTNVIYSTIDWVLYLNSYQISNNRKFYYLWRGIAFDPFADGLKQGCRRSIKKWLNKQIFTQMFDIHSTENLCSHNNSSCYIFVFSNLTQIWPKSTSNISQTYLNLIWNLTSMINVIQNISLHTCTYLWN